MSTNSLEERHYILFERKIRTLHTDTHKGYITSKKFINFLVLFPNVYYLPFGGSVV